MKLFKKYIILFFIYLITILGVFYFCSLYNKANIFLYDDSIDMFVLDSSDYDKFYENINNYMYENDNFVVFYSLNGVSSSLKDFMINYDLTHEFLYIDSFNDFRRLAKDFSYDFSGSKNDSFFAYFVDGKVIDVVNCSNFSYEDFYYLS